MSTDLHMICAQCGTEFTYSRKEFKRQTAKGRTKFFCSISCGTRYNNTHRSEETQRKMSAALSKRSIGNTFGSKGKFRYYLRKSYQRDPSSDLDEAFLSSIWSGKCALTGVSISLKKGKHLLTTASLDRKDSTIGYTKNNVQFVAYGINLAKNTFTDAEMMSFIQEIRANHNFSDSDAT